MERRIKIIATLGPSSEKEEVLEGMIDAGMNMARLNFSWGTHEGMLLLIKNIRTVASRKGIVIPIIQDLSGPRLVLEHGHTINSNLEEVITEKDIQDLYFGLDNGVEYVALSYVATPDDIHTLREHMVKHGNMTPIIAKIERKEALEHIEAICDVADGIMIARGDLGVAFPFEEVPFIERKVIEVCRRKNKFVIVATETMLSMVHNETPSRAEVNDVATAVLLGADAIMLSEESARGEHPVEVISALHRIIIRAESEEFNPSV
jgi:pyruvate kinase